MDAAEAAAIAGRHARISDKIRALHAAGCGRGEIARLLNRSPQQVRQVLALDEARRARASEAQGLGERDAPAFDRTGAGSRRTLRLELHADGSIRLPASLEAAMGWRRGGVVIAEVQDDRLVLLSTAAALQRARDIVAAAIPPGGPSLVDELIEDRRREARRELEDD